MENVIKEGAFLVDVRTEAEFAEGHVNGSTNIPLDQVADQFEKFKGKEQISPNTIKIVCSLKQENICFKLHTYFFTNHNLK